MQPIREGAGRARRPPTKAIVTTLERPDLAIELLNGSGLLFGKKMVTHLTISVPWSPVPTLLSAQHSVSCFSLTVNRSEPQVSSSMI